MEDLVETEFGTLPAHLIDDVDSLKELIIDEIERSLPKIISDLKMPQPIDRYAMHVLQHRLRTGHGFRPLSPAERVKSVEQLKDEAFLRNLRKVQELASVDLSSSSAGAVVFQESYSSEATNTRLWNRIRDDLTEVGVPRIKNIEKSESATFGAFNSASTMVQEQTALEGLGELLSRPVPEIETKESVLEIPSIPIELQEPVAQRDVRGLVAVLRNGRLLTFIEPATIDLIPKDVDVIPIPDRKVFRALNLEDLMSEYHEIAVEQSDVQVVKLRLLDALIVSLENEAQWSRINKRRFHLITKKHSVGLDTAESTELLELQSLADKHADSVQPLPFSELAMLKDYARKLGFLEGPFAP